MTPYIDFNDLQKLLRRIGTETFTTQLATGLETARAPGAVQA